MSAESRKSSPSGPRGRGAAARDEALRVSLHGAVARIRQALADDPVRTRSESELDSLRERFADHGVIVGARRGLLDVPTPQVLSACTTPDWASRSVLHFVALQAAVEDELRGMLSVAANEETPSGNLVPTWTAPKRSTGDDWLGIPSIWQGRVAEPLGVLDELWTTTCRAVLRRAPDADALLRRLDLLLPATHDRDVAPLSGGAGVQALRERIAEGAIAWDDPASAPSAGTLWVPEGSGANPWLLQAANGVPTAGITPTLSTAWWSWLRALWSRLTDRVSASLVPAVTELLSRILTRLLALWADHVSRREAESPSPTLPTGGIDLEARGLPSLRAAVAAESTTAAPPPARPRPVRPRPVHPAVDPPTPARRNPSPATPAPTPQAAANPATRPTGTATKTRTRPAPTTPPAPAPAQVSTPAPAPVVAAPPSPTHRVSSVRTLSGPSTRHLSETQPAQEPDADRVAALARIGLLPVSGAISKVRTTKSG
ncbi:hypothetical protein OG948_32935 [Embleya sp. NBC_00888]|uniref:hypothetical protein n=1 Tax=Embleya sp. NBC_00888 TaxID=2975960 RepID=UPI0038650A58|nr:hypothetical protein OG948_32935 [Embleya sp. NBC_00888]